MVNEKPKASRSARTTVTAVSGDPVTLDGVAGELASFEIRAGMRGRPAETSAGVVALGSLLAVTLGVNDSDQIACMIAALGAVPGAVTLYVDAGGLRGILRKVWRGKDA